MALEGSAPLPWEGATGAVQACPMLRAELEVVAGPVGLPLEFVGHGCPCALPPPGGPAGGLAASDVPAGGPALRCAGAASHGPPTCFHLLAGEAQVEELLAEGAHLVTPGWLRSWPDHLAALGLDPPTARALFGESARRVVLLDTGAGPDPGPDLTAFADHVGLPAERRLVGLELLRLRVALAAAERRARRAEQRAADEAALLDAIGGLEPEADEDAVVERYLFLLRLLLAPAHIGYLPVVDGASGPLTWQGEGDPGPLEAALRAMPPGADATTLPDGGLLLRVGPRGGEAGRLGLAGIQFPQHVERYLELAPILAQACFLSVSRARAVARLARSEADLRLHRDHLEELVAERTADLKRTVGELEAAREKSRLLSGLLPICFGCKKIRDDSGYWTQLEVYIQAHSDAQFSHGLCGDCLERLYPDEK